MRPQRNSATCSSGRARSPISNRAISVLLVPTATPGFEIRPVPSIVGEHSFHELFSPTCACRCRVALGRRTVAGTSYGRPWRSSESAPLVTCGRRGYSTRHSMWMAVHDRPVPVELREEVAQARAACAAARILVYQVIDERAQNGLRARRCISPEPQWCRPNVPWRLVVADLLGADGLVTGSLAERADTQVDGGRPRRRLLRDAAEPDSRGWRSSSQRPDRGFALTDEQAALAGRGGTLLAPSRRAGSDRGRSGATSPPTTPSWTPLSTRASSLTIALEPEPARSRRL